METSDMAFHLFFSPTPQEVAEVLWNWNPKSKSRSKPKQPHYKKMTSTTSPKTLDEKSDPETMTNENRPSSRLLHTNRDVLLGPLPDDFLRIDSADRQRQIEEDERTAIAIANQQE